MKHPLCGREYPHVFDGLNCPICFDENGNPFKLIGQFLTRVRRFGTRIRRLWRAIG